MAELVEGCLIRVHNLTAFSTDALCEPNPCKNGGRCIKDGDDFDCECPTGFRGRFCHVGKCHKMRSSLAASTKQNQKNLNFFHTLATLVHKLHIWCASHSPTVVVM